MEQPAFDITDYNFFYLAFHLVLGFVVAQLYSKIPKKDMWPVHVLAALILIAIWRYNRDVSQVWTIVAIVETLVGAALSSACYRFKPNRSDPK